MFTDKYLWGSYELPGDGVGAPKYVGASDLASQWSDNFYAFVGFYEDIRYAYFACFSLCH
jgi:hypothetical protein